MSSLSDHLAAFDAALAARDWAGALHIIVFDLENLATRLVCLAAIGPKRGRARARREFEAANAASRDALDRWSAAHKAAHP